MNIANYNERINRLAVQYNEKLQSLQLQSLSSHEYGALWNEEQHKLLDSIKEEADAFVRESAGVTIDFEELRKAGRKVLDDYNILITVPA